MQAYEFEGKTIEDVKEKIKKELKKEENELVIKIKEENKGLFKAKKVEATVYTHEEIIKFVKEKIIEITNMMGIETNLELRKINDSYNIKLFSDHNALLIGKNGKTLSSLQLILKQTVFNKINANINFVLDVENYKEKQHRNIEYLAKKIAYEVSKTKVEAKLTDMNSYERRLVHSILTDYKGVYTESEGEEPNRYVIIKPSKE